MMPMRHPAMTPTTGTVMTHPLHESKRGSVSRKGSREQSSGSRFGEDEIRRGPPVMHMVVETGRP